MKKVKELFLYALPFLKNKFVLATAGFIVWITLFDDYNLVDRFNYNQKIQQLKKEKEHYNHQIKENKRKINELQSDRKNLEKFAREEYLMKKKNEDIFLFLEED